MMANVSIANDRKTLLFGENVNNDGKCLNCERQENIVNERKRSRESLDKQAAKMLKLSNQKFSEVQVGTTVRVPIPDVDRARGSPRNVLAVVSDVEDGLYKLCTTHGVLKHKFTRSEFNPCMEQFILLENLSDSAKNKEISLREAAAENSILGSQGYRKSRLQALSLQGRM
ncbi:hypothetical protein QE152_g14382 [Popillia japonica]|uniref:Uncharacterized protein n=1 Tax=Popillia japonica TaxID=7064 RepID=A0AAW1L9U6_POPJA